MIQIPSSLIKNFITSEFTGATRVESGEYHFNSPFDTRDKKKRCYINENDGRWIDFKAGLSGNFLSFVKEYIGLNTYQEAINYLVENYSFVYDKPEPTKKQIEAQETLKKFLIDSRPTLFREGQELDKLGTIAYTYIKNRKIDETYISKMGYIGDNGSKYNKRIFIPFFEDGRLVYALARAIEPKNNLRYLNISGLDSKEFVFNIDNINEELIICEGVFDAMSITRDQPATCLMSADIGLKQLKKIYDKRPNTIIYVPDNDETGKNKMIKNIKKIIEYCPYSNLNIYTFDVPKDCKDLNDMKIKYGKDYILKKECKKFGEGYFNKGL